MNPVNPDEAVIHSGSDVPARGSEEHLNESSSHQESYQVEAISLDIPDTCEPGEVEICEEPTAVDLRTVRESEEFYCSKQQSLISKSDIIKREINIDELQGDFNEVHAKNSNLPKMMFTDPFFYSRSYYSTYIVTSVDSYGMPTDYSTGKSSNGKELVCDTKYWDCSTNTESVPLVDRWSQTPRKDTKDVSVQTDSLPVIATIPITKALRRPIIKYACSLCDRLYTAKSSYERHFRSHGSAPDGKQLTYVPIKTETLQVYTTQEACQPFVIQVPRGPDHRCVTCQRTFTSQAERSAHNCLTEPQPPNKCPHCPVIMYTPAGLKDHVSKVHKHPGNLYYCVFCDESFDTNYNFHLHLDSHLSP